MMTELTDRQAIVESGHGQTALRARVVELERVNAQLRQQVAAFQAGTTRKKAKSRYQARRIMLIRQGQWHPYQPAAPVRDHVRAVMGATGISRSQYAAAAGVDEGTVSKILYGNQRNARTVTAAR